MDFDRSFLRNIRWKGLTVDEPQEQFPQFDGFDGFYFL